MTSSKSSAGLTHLLLGCCLAFAILAGNGSNAFQISKTSRSAQAQEGSTVKLFCRSDSYYEYCTWRHKSDICEYEWKSDHGKVIKQRCSNRIDSRIKFTGNYEGHECRIELTGVRAEDAGEWSCEMEDYVWGIARGTSEKRKVFLTVVKEEIEEEIHESQEQLSNESEVLVERFDFPTTTSSAAADAADAPVTHDAIDGNIDDVEDSEHGGDDDEKEEEVEYEEEEEEDHDSESPSILTDKETLDYVDSLANDINANSAISGEISATDNGDDFPYAAVIAGVFGALFVRMLIFGVCYQRRNRKRALEADWKEKQEDIENDKNIFESKEDEESNIGIRSEANKPLSVIGEEALEAKLDINPEEQSITYHGSRSYSVNDD